jgi:tRNA threonylcarbamoyladenosine biosynthesis protein TsaE
LSVFNTHNVKETIELGKKVGETLHNGDVVAYFGPMGMGKTAFTHGLAAGLGIDERMVSSPTFALVHEYKGADKVLYHFDMYRIDSWDDLYSTGYFDYLNGGAVLAIEWSENIENALPEKYIKISFASGEKENDRIITITGDRWS